MRGIGKCLMVFFMLLAAVPVDGQAGQPASAPPSTNVPVTVSEACSAECAPSASNPTQYADCLFNCENKSTGNLPSSANVAPSAIP